MRNLRQTLWAILFLTAAALPGVRLNARQAKPTAPAPAPAASASTAPTIDQSLEMKSASNPQISPDGKYVAYEVSRTNWEDNAFERDLWIADTATGN